MENGTRLASLSSLSKASFTCCGALFCPANVGKAVQSSNIWADGTPKTTWHTSKGHITFAFRSFCCVLLFVSSALALDEDTAIFTMPTRVGFICFSRTVTTLSNPRWLQHQLVFSNSPKHLLRCTQNTAKLQTLSSLARCHSCHNYNSAQQPLQTSQFGLLQHTYRNADQGAANQWLPSSRNAKSRDVLAV